MKTKLLTLSLLAILFSLNLKAQTQGVDHYDFGIVHVEGYNFKVVAIPNFNSTEAFEDMGFSLMLPTGDTDIDAASVKDLLGGRNWIVNANATGDLLKTHYGTDGTKDAFIITLEATGSPNSITHTAGTPIDLISFSITNAPTTGELEFIKNSDQLAINADPVFNSFANIDITDDYFNSYATGQETFSFASLGTTNLIAENEISIYPNPTKGEFKLKSSNLDIDYTLYNVLGQSVNINGTLAKGITKSISLSDLQDGIYLLKVKIDDNTYKSYKIVKNK